MSKKGLSEEVVRSIKEMSINGVLPQDVATALKISVSTVHHYKNIMKKEGTSFPDFRGQRPTRDESISESNEMPTFIVNGTKISITGKPLLIKIGPKTVEIDY